MIDDNGEAMIDAEDYNINKGLNYSKLDKSTGDKLILRENVCKKLAEAQTELNKLKPGYKLILVYAYRSLRIQTSSFKKIKTELGLQGRDDIEAMEKVHPFIAVPSVAGHPTGGAVDVLIENAQGKALNFGTSIHEMTKDSYVFSPFISDEACNNRKLLRSIMQNIGFAPYDGEWWHFSFGDREWAAYYNKDKAIYTQIEYKAEN